MDRNREARRAAASMAAAPNGLSRRRHRSSSLRDSPEEDGPVELQEPARLRDRGLKKERERDRDRERERERTSRSSKRRRGDRLMNGGDDSSEEESLNYDEDDEDDVDVAGAFTRMLPPLPNTAVSAPPPPPLISTNHNHSHHHQHRKSFPQPTAAKVFKAAAVPAWKAADEMIGVSVPRKARSASTKRSHDWISGGGEQMIHLQASTSPVRHGLVSSTPSPAAGRDAPLSPPSSSNASVRKKIKPNGGAKLRPPPKSATTSKSSSSNNNPEELEIEIAEVLYGLMTQSQAPSKNDSSSKLELNNKSSSEAKSRISSPVSSSSPSTSILPQNSSSSAAPLSASAGLKTKKPRQVADNNLMGSFSTRSSPVMKVEIDQTPTNEISSSNFERTSGSAAENGDSLAEAKNQSQLQPLKVMKLEAFVLSESKGALTEEAGESRDVVLTMEEVTSLKESTAVKLNDNSEDVTVTSIVTATKVITEVSEIESKREENFQIDLMAPPPQLRASAERDGAIDFAGDQKRMVIDMEKMGEMIKDKEYNKVGKTSKEETIIQLNEKRAKVITEEVESQNSSINKERNIDLQFDLEKPDREINKLLPHQVLKSQLPSPKATLREEQPRTDKVGQPSSLPLPMSIASWPGGLPPPLGYMAAPLQGVISMDGNAMSSTPIQPLFSQPRPKRCATHCHIARNIHYYQQLMKMNPFWPAAAGSPSVFGAKPCNLNVMPSAELHGNVAGRSVNSVQDKGQGLAIFPGPAGKDKAPQPAIIPDSAQRKQQILLQQALPPVTPSNILHGPAFIFPFNQQQAAVAAVSARPASAKSTTNTGSLASSSAPASATVISSAPASATGLSFNYPNIPANETQYLVLQNNPYPFPIPAVGAPPNFGGTHAQPMPMFNGSFYPSQMIHPSQLQQQLPQPSQQQQIQQAHQNTSSGSTSSQKHLQSQQQRPQGSAINGGGTGSGNFKNRSSQQSQQHQNQHITPPQERQLESEMGGEDTPSTADSRLSRATMNIYGQNFAMPIRPQNFALMNSSDALASASQNDKKHQQHHHHQQHQMFKAGVESLPPQAFAMSFGPINGSTSASGIDISSMAHNHAILQTLPEAARQSYHQIMHAAAAAQVAQQKKNSRMSEDGKSGGGDSSNADEERKVIARKAPASSGGQSIAFSRPDLTDVSGSALPGNSVVDSSARTLNLASGPTRMPNVMGAVGTPNSHLQAQFQHHQQQQIIQLHNQQQHQQQLAARSKMPATSNGSAYSEHLISSSAIAAKFPNSLSGYPQNFVQSSNTSSPAQSPQWKNSTRTPTSQVQSSLTSSTSSLKNHPQQQTRTQQSHTQISFGSNQKSSASQGQLPPNSSNQSSSPPVVVGSPTHSSISKGASASPRTTTASTNKSGQASTMSSQQAKNTSSIPSQKSSPVNVPSILGNPHITSSSSSGGTKTQIQQQHQQLQQQLSKQTLQQALFFSNPYLQAQPPNSTTSNASAASGYYLQRRRPEQLQQSQQPQGTTVSSSTGMLSLCTPVTLSSTSTTDPAKAVAAAAAAAAASNMKGGGLSSQGTLHAAQYGAQSSGNPHQLLPVGFSYGHSVPAAVQVKPAEQKQPAA